MINTRKSILSIWMALSLIFSPVNTVAEDIDIFTGASAGAAERPNVLIVLDNTSNWARQSQQWPGGLTQGQAEVRSIKNVLDSLGSDINVGVMEFVTKGNANNIGGYIRFPILPMDATNKAALKAEMDEIFGDINGVDEKRNSGTEYGNLAYDVYNYFAGRDVGSNSSGLNPPSPKVDVRGYDINYSNFKTPLSSASSCAKNYVIFIGNPSSSGPSSDSAENKAELTGVGCSAANISLPNFTMQTSVVTNNLGNTNLCYVSQAACNTAVGAEYLRSGDTTYTSKSCGEPVAATPTCADGTRRYSVIANDIAGTKNLGQSSSCVANTNTCDTSQFAADCTGVGVSCSCKDYTTTGCSGKSGNKYKYTVARTKSNTTANILGYSDACYASAPAYASADYASQCSIFAQYASGSGCIYSTPTTTSTSCETGTSQYNILGNSIITTAAPNGTYDNTGKGSAWNLDEWARCMYTKGIPVSGGDNQTAAFYTIDVYNAQQNNDHTALLMSAAHQGGGKYFAATNEGALFNALKQIFAEIQSVNSTFASASLPVNATNRAQNENQVFIGMFRPDQNMRPRWYGNLKRYQIVFDSDGVNVTLGDKNGTPAINKQTGFIGDCAVSYWTTDSPIDPNDLSKGYYWSNVAVSPNPASKCAGLDPSKVYSDLPDGPTVEKGAVAEVIRKGNNPPTTDSAPTWAANKRTIYTTSGPWDTGLILLESATFLNDSRKLWVKGLDTGKADGTDKEVNALSTSQTRASLHGDVVHSRPLPVTYGPDNGAVYYGANDGMFRAVDAETGNELWALMPFEFAQSSYVDRLRNNEPLIKYPNTDMTISPTPQPKAYGWDGAIGIAQDKTNTKVWIYPTMRRGGQMVYALDVSIDKFKTKPTILWKNGCYGGSCTAGFENMGQTWSAPSITRVAGYTAEKVAIFGGGYDTCEDIDDLGGSCSSPKGANIYVVDAGSGNRLKTFSTERSVASEISLIDMDNDGKSDYGYVGDTGGNLYRIDMVTRSVVSGAAVYTPLAPDAWTIRKIGTAGTGRKFLFQPALFPVSRSGRVYVAIGSGDREHPLASNQAFSVTNRFYVYLDDVRVTTGAAKDLNSLDDRTEDLGCESQAILPSSSDVGWYMDLNQYGAGEQTVTSALIIGGQVAFSTNRPIPPAAGTCSTVLGEARGYWVNLFSGSGTIRTNDGACGGDRSSVFVGGGMPPSPVSFDVTINGRNVTGTTGTADPDGGASAGPDAKRAPFYGKPIRTRTYHKVKGVD